MNNLYKFLLEKSLECSKDIKDKELLYFDNSYSEIEDKLRELITKSVDSSNDVVMNYVEKIINEYNMIHSQNLNNTDKEYRFYTSMLSWFSLTLDNACRIEDIYS